MNESAKKDRELYKRLCVALDEGDEDAEEEIDDLMEWSSLRHDDSQFEVAAAHWELGAAYLEGTSDLPRDMTLAAKHLAQAFSLHRSLDAINVGTNEHYDATALLARLPDDARVVLEHALKR